MIHLDWNCLRKRNCKRISQTNRYIYKDRDGFILSTGCEYPANADLRNAEVMVETAKNYGKYKIKMPVSSVKIKTKIITDIINREKSVKNTVFSLFIINLNESEK